jgi:hydrogenase maturation protease
MTGMASPKRVVVMGVGNTLQQDDGIGIHITETLRKSSDASPEISFIDGGTIGLSLLPEIEDADAVIVVDASEIGESPGSMRIFRNEEIDRQLCNKRRTVHEVALVDLFSAAAIRGRSPAERVLVAIQPESTDTGLEPTTPVRDAIPRACEAINDITNGWLHET